jgi:hypothetical protein
MTEKKSNFEQERAARARRLRAKKASKEAMLDLPKPMNPYERLMAKIDAENNGQKV